MNFLKTSIWPVFAGFVVASIVMFILEVVNSLFFPLPEGLDWQDPTAVHAFTASLPWTAYILVLLGYILGSFKGGCVTTYLSGERTYRRSFALGAILTLAAIANLIAIGHPVWFAAVSLPLFFVCTYIGHRYLLYVHAKRDASFATMQ